MIDKTRYDRIKFFYRDQIMLIFVLPVIIFMKRSVLIDDE